jgi:hypothetical protein
MMTDTRIATMHRRMVELFGTRFNHLMWQLLHFAGARQRFDATFHHREPCLDVALDEGWAEALLSAHRHMTGSEQVRTLSKLVRNIKFSDGTATHADAILTLNYMPDGGITIAEMDGADLAIAETKAGLGGETVRQMLRETYRCRSAAEEDWFVRRWIAS